MSNLFYQIPEISNTLFGSNVKLLPSVDELFEIELANLEYHILNKDELIERSAFFQSVNGNLTKHFKLYSVHTQALSENRSAQTKNYFKNGQFSTGYATHGLHYFIPDPRNKIDHTSIRLREGKRNCIEAKNSSLRGFVSIR